MGQNCTQILTRLKPRMRFKLNPRKKKTALKFNYKKVLKLFSLYRQTVFRQRFESPKDLRHASLHGHGHTSVTSTLWRASGKPALYDSPGQFSGGRSAECQERMGEGKKGRNTHGNRSSGAIWQSFFFSTTANPAKDPGQISSTRRFLRARLSGHWWMDTCYLMKVEVMCH